MKDVGAGYISAGMNRTGDQYVILLEVTSPVEGSSTLRLHNSVEESITAWNYDGTEAATYSRAPFTVDNIQSNISNELPKITITLQALPDSIVGAYVKGHFGMRGGEVNLIAIFKNHITGTAAEADYRETSSLTIDSAVINDNQVVFTLATQMEIFNATIPRRQFYRDFCSRRYDATASFDGRTKRAIHSQGYCDQPDSTSTGCPRTLEDMDGRDGCRTRGYRRLFTGFPNIPLNRVRIS